MMNSATVRLRHEVRLLAPYAAGMIVCQAAFGFGTYLSTKTGHSNLVDVTSMVVIAGALGMLLLCVCALCVQSFVSEFHNGTFAQLVVQPTSRLSLWLEKTGMTISLFLAAASPGIFYCAYRITNDDVPFSIIVQVGCFLISCGAAVVTAGPGIAMLSRRPLPSLLLLLGYCIGLCAIIVMLDKWMVADRGDWDQLFINTATAILGSLAIAAYVFGYRYFKQLEV